MRSTLLCFLGIILAVGVHSFGDIPLELPDFSSHFLNKKENAGNILGLMKTHFNNSLDYLYSGKYYDSQEVDYPGMAKLLVEESDRQWEEGMSVLKKYLHLRGTTEGDFTSYMEFSRNIESRDGVDVQYKNSLKKVMEKSHRLTKEITELHSSANKKKGEAALLHFLEEKAEKETDVARKMAGLYVMLHEMSSNGIALGIFDQSL